MLLKRAVTAVSRVRFPVAGANLLSRETWTVSNSCEYWSTLEWSVLLVLWCPLMSSCDSKANVSQLFPLTLYWWSRNQPCKRYPSFQIDIKTLSTFSLQVVKTCHIRATLLLLLTDRKMGSIKHAMNQYFRQMGCDGSSSDALWSTQKCPWS